MAITIKEIAKIAGVSIGTVDRALHDRGRVDPDLATRIREIARENGFEPSRAGRTLALARKPVKIGVVVHLTKTEFMRQVVQGIGRVKAELESFGAEILVKDIPSLDVDAQIQALDELVAAGAQGIAISPAEDDGLRARIDAISAQGIPFVTFNTDMAGSRRACFVGLDNLQSGKAAAGLMGAIMARRGKVAVITGHLTNQASSRRAEGFMQELRKSFPEILVTGVQVCFDEDSVAEQLTIQSLGATPDLAGIFVCAGGQAGVCAGIEKLGAADRVRVAAYDLIPATVRGLKNGIIDFVIDQNAFLQGYQPAMILYDMLFNKKPPARELMHTDILIKTKYNL
jgi:LacI family transcriptional regulator